jgi:hypothetical protein
MNSTLSRYPEAKAETGLVDYVERLSRFRQGRRAIHLHLSQLQPYNRRDHHLRIAVATFEAMVRLFEGQAFLLGNSDIVFIANEATPAAIEEAVVRVRYLFEDDPLIRRDAAENAARFCTHYDLGAEYDHFLHKVRALHEEEMRRQQRLAAAPKEQAAKPRPALDAQHLSGLIERIGRADLSSLIRRQPVCVIVPNQAPRPIFRELYVSIADLCGALLPDYDIAVDRGLFQYLTRALDRRMLAALRRNDDGLVGSGFSININVASVLSPEFLAFDADLRAGARGTIVLELQYADIVGDLEAYFFARDFARGRSYRLCLDGVGELMLPFVDREQLGVDFVKLMWSLRMENALASGKLEVCRNAVERFGRDRTILCRCDDEAAVRFGQDLGIAMFQGRGVDRMLAAGGTGARASAA